MAGIFLKVLGLCAVVVAMAGLSFVIAAWLAGIGMFGPCMEGNCAYGALFVGWPLVCAILCGMLFAAWRVWRRHRGAGPGDRPRHRPE